MTMYGNGNLWGHLDENFNAKLPLGGQFPYSREMAKHYYGALHMHFPENERDTTKTIGPVEVKPLCLHKYPYSTGFFFPCFKEHGHLDFHEHRSTSKDPAYAKMTTTSPNVTDIVLYDEDGRPLPVTSYTKGYEYCSETGKYEHSSIVVNIKSIGARVIWPGKDGKGFVYYTDEGFTVVRIMEMKNKVWLSTKYFNGTMTKNQIRQLIFETSSDAKVARDEAQKGGKPYRATFRHTIMAKADFDKQFKPNILRYQTYVVKADDTALKSIGEILRTAPSSEVDAGHAATAINNAMKAIRASRNNYLKALTAETEKDAFPVVEVYAIWQNFDFDAKLIYSAYDASEPLFYQYNTFRSPQELSECPT
jgi:hypothetical protein